MIAAILALLLSFTIHLAPAPAHGGSRGPSAPSPAGRLDGSVSRLPQLAPAPDSVPQVDVDEPTCLAGEEWDGLRCVALQLPEEAAGGDRR